MKEPSIAATLFNLTVGACFNNPYLDPFFRLNILNLGEWYEDRARKPSPVEGMTREELYLFLQQGSRFRVAKMSEQEFYFEFYPPCLEGTRYEYHLSIRYTTTNGVRFFDFREGLSPMTCGPRRDFIDHFPVSPLREFVNENISIEKDKPFFLSDSYDWDVTLSKEDVEHLVPLADLEPTEYSVSYYPKLEEEQDMDLRIALRELHIEMHDQKAYEVSFTYTPLVIEGGMLYFKDKEYVSEQLPRVMELLGLPTDKKTELYVNPPYPCNSLLAKTY